VSPQTFVKKTSPSESMANFKPSALPINETLHLLIVGGAWNTISAIVNRVLPNLLIIVLALFVKPSELGIYSYILAAYLVLSLLADLGIAFSLQKFIQESLAETATMATTALVLRILSSIALGAFCMAADYFWRALKGQSLYISLLLVSSAFGTAIFVLNARLKYKKASLLTMARTVFWFVLAMILVSAGLHISGPIWALILSYVIFGVLTIFLEKSLFGKRFDWHFVRKIIQFGVPMTAASSFNVLATQAGVLGIAYLMTESEVGIYKLATTFGMIPMLLGDALVLPLLPLVKKGMIDNAKETAELIRLLIRFLTIVGFFMLGAGLVLVKPLINLFFGTVYQNAVEPSRILLGASFLGLLFTVLLSILYMSDHLKIAAEITGIVAALSVGGSLALIPARGATGAAFSLLFAFGIGLLLVGGWLRRRLSVWLEWRKYGISALSMVEMGILLAFFVSPIRSQVVSLLGGMILAPCLYILALIIQKGLTRAEIFRLLQIMKVKSKSRWLSGMSNR